MRKFLTILLLIISTFAFSQKVVIRSNGANTIADTRWEALQNMFIPRYADTTAASAGDQIGIDSCGALIFTYAGGGVVYVRKCYPVKYWAAVGGGGAGTITGGTNGLSASSANLILGGSDLDRYTAIGLNGFPLTLRHDGIN